MKLQPAAPALALCLIATASLPAFAADKTTADGVFTAAQAQSGKALFTERCEVCHGPDLMGTPGGPGLAGGIFKFKWAGKQTVGDLFALMTAAMPADAPGTMTPPQYTDLAAYILSVNEYPAGEAELPADEAALKAIVIAAK